MVMQKTNTNSDAIVDFEKEIYKIMNKIFQKNQQNELNQLFNSLKVKNCDTRFGWTAGVALSVICKFTKGGENQPLLEVVKGIKRKAEFCSFLCGLWPDYLHFNSQTLYEEGDNVFLMFKLVRNERIKDM